MQIDTRTGASGTATRIAVAAITMIVALGWSAKADPSRLVVFDAADGFSGVQGSNGWSYVGLQHRDLTNLAARQVLGIFDTARHQWNVNVGGAILTLTATQQNMTEGDARWSARCWTADRDYRAVAVASTLDATTNVGARIVFAPKAASAGSTVTKGMEFSSATGIAAGCGTQAVPVHAWLTDVKQGDRIYFILQNAGVPGANGSFILQPWRQKITAVP